MKRLISKNKSKTQNNDQQIADKIYTDFSEWVEVFPDEAARYIKQKLKNRHYDDLEEFFNNDYDVRDMMVNVLKNSQDVFDRVFDVFYGDPSQRDNDTWDTMVIIVKDVIDNFQKFGYDAKNLMSEKLKSELKKIW